MPCEFQTIEIQKVARLFAFMKLRLNSQHTSMSLCGDDVVSPTIINKTTELRMMIRWKLKENARCQDSLSRLHSCKYKTLTFLRDRFSLLNMQGHLHDTSTNLWLLFCARQANVFLGGCLDMNVEAWLGLTQHMQLVDFPPPERTIALRICYLCSAYVGD